MPPAPAAAVGTSCHRLPTAQIPRLATLTGLLLISMILSSCGGAGRTPSTVFASTSGLEISGKITLSATFPAARVGTGFNAVIAVSGGQAPYQFATTWGTLPPGLTLNSATGTLSGTPQQAGTYNFAVTATDRPRHDYGDHRFLLEVAGGGGNHITVAISPTSATVNSGATQQFTATVSGTSNTAVTWSATLGTISNTGLFTAPTVTTTTSVTVTATSVADTTKSASAAVTVVPISTGPTITTTSIPPATAGMPYSTVLSASGGKTPYTWSVSSGTLPQGIKLNSSTGTLSGTTNQTGNFSFTAMVADASSKTDTQGLSLSVSNANTGGFDGPAELPRVYVLSSLADTPAPGKTITVNAGGDFQGALTSASCGDTITLQAGATFTGNYTFPSKGCDDQHWIIVRTSASDSSLPAEGTRLTPCYAGVSSLPGRPALNCKSTSNVMAKIVQPQTGTGPILFAVGASHYRLLGLEVTRPTGGGIVYALASFVNQGPADHIVFDRMWFHGTAKDDTNKGVQLGGTSNIAVVDSFFTDLHCESVSGACTDSLAVSGGVGDIAMGPYKIHNNFLEASGENILFGGSEATLTPADIEVTHNHMFKPLTWLQGQSGFVGGPNGNPFVVKNLFELKNAQRVLLEGNILEDSWGGFSQSGYGILLTPKNQSTGTTNICPLCQVTDVTIRYNTLSHMAAGLQIANVLSDTGGAPLDGQRYSIHDITIDDIDGVKYAGPGTFAQVSMGLGNPVLQNILINHVTAFAPNTFLNVGDDNAAPKMANFTFTNSIENAGIYPVWSTGGITNCAYWDKPQTTFDACFSPYSFVSNAMIAVPNNSPSSSWPVGNFFPTNTSAVQFVNYNNGNGGDYHLQSSSPYKNAGTDGKDLGADIDAINAAIAGAQ